MLEVECSRGPKTGSRGQNQSGTPKESGPTARSPDTTELTMPEPGGSIKFGGAIESGSTIKSADTGELMGLESTGSEPRGSIRSGIELAGLTIKSAGATESTGAVSTGIEPTGIESIIEFGPTKSTDSFLLPLTPLRKRLGDASVAFDCLFEAGG